MVKYEGLESRVLMKEIVDYGETSPTVLSMVTQLKDLKARAIQSGDRIFVPVQKVGDIQHYVTAQIKYIDGEQIITYGNDLYKRDANDNFIKE